MAIIRIKRTTSSSLPTGLTFGELAFVGASGGATANRLYIAGPEGTCLWIGAQILNTPQIQYWSGVTAQTTLASIAAIEDRMVAGGAITFANNLSVNIATGKWFGKYTRGDTIPAIGKTVKEVVELALSENISPTVVVSAITGTQPAYGQTFGSLTVPVTYTILTAGASAAGSTLEFRYGTRNWTVLSTSLKDDSKGTNQPYTASYTHNWNRLTDSNSPGTGFSTEDFQYRYTVHDTSGASATSAPTTRTVAPFADIPNSGNPSAFYSGGITAASLRTGLLGYNGTGVETNTYREKGNTFTTVNFTLQRQNEYIPLSSYVLQAAEWVNGSYGAWNTIKTETISGNPSSITRGLTYNPTATGASLDRLKFRVRVNDSYYDGAAVAGPGTTKDIDSSDIFFDYLMFFGATTNTSINATMIRGLSSGIVAGNNNGSGGGAGGGAGALPTTLNGIMPSSNAAALTGPNSNLKFILAMPDSVTTSLIIDAYNNSDTTNQFVLDTGVTTINDRNGGTKNYNVYVATSTGFTDAVHTFNVTRTGTVTTP